MYISWINSPCVACYDICQWILCDNLRLLFDTAQIWFMTRNIGSSFEIVVDSYMRFVLERFTKKFLVSLIFVRFCIKISKIYVMWVCEWFRVNINWTSLCYLIMDFGSWYVFKSFIPLNVICLSYNIQWLWWVIVKLDFRQMNLWRYNWVF